VTEQKGVQGSVTGRTPHIGRIDPDLVSDCVELLWKRREPRGGVEYELEKLIPVASGLGGGSADAAAALLALNDLLRYGLDERELMELGAELGSDVPALLLGGPAIMRGRGDVVEAANVAPTWWVLAPQDFPVSTPDAYRWWDEDGRTGPDPAPLLAAASEGRLDALAALSFNDLEPVVAGRHPEVGEARKALREAGALGAVMSGSGPTVAGLARDEAHAREIAERISGAIPVSAPP
jgi:4-diphosphocytidyl-2-C-methyl-D-erythritol kinase